MNELLASLRQRFDELDARERRLVLLFAWLFSLALLWFVAVGPALYTVRATPAARETLEQSQLEMSAQAAEAKALRAVPAVSPAQARQALEAACARLGAAAQVQVNGGRAVITLRELPPEGLSALLAEARSAARAHAVEAQLQHVPAGYSGTLTLALPGGPQ
jgi:general secretion pathway protein M